MQWQAIRENYPQQWLLLEAITAHSEGEMRVLDQLAVLGAYADSVAAMQSYTQVHRESPALELYVFHTSRESLDVVERQWLGVRSLR